MLFYTFLLFVKINFRNINNFDEKPYFHSLMKYSHWSHVIHLYFNENLHIFGTAPYEERNKILKNHYGQFQWRIVGIRSEHKKISTTNE